MQYLYLIGAILLSAASGFSITTTTTTTTKIQLQQQQQQPLSSSSSCSISHHTRSRRKGYSTINYNSQGSSSSSSSALFSTTPDVQGNNNNNSSSSSSQSTITSKPKAEEEDEEEEWEYEEYEMLTEADFYDSEWKVGTLMENSNKIVETWTRLVVRDGEFICVWGDGSSGKWNFDGASQFLSMSKDTYGGWLGKKIWAGSIGDYYYVEGTVRGWSPISPASVVGQWQAKRLGVDSDEAGIAPWFEEDDDEDESEESQVEAKAGDVDSALEEVKEKKEGDN